jgi:TATA-box binding protein (TBP) (component of TFIID and TFIIIB)
MNTVKISTITISTNLPDCKINLTNVGKYLDINDDILGIKYQYANLNIMKGKYSTNVYRKSKIKKKEKINKFLFYNQISLILNDKINGPVNIKLFNNGSLHITGCKSIDQGYKITKSIYVILNELKRKNDTILLTKDEYGVLLDSKDFIYSYNDFQIIGYKSNRNLYIINKKEYEIDLYTGMLVSKKTYSQRKKHIINFSGEEIGTVKIELLKNKNKFYKNNSNIFYDHLNNLIFHNNNIIGKIVYAVDENKITKTDSVSNVLEHSYDCNPFINKDYLLDINAENFNSLIDLDVNCINIYFNLDFKINRQKLYNRLIELNYICKYTPESYSGVKLLYKIPLNDQSNIINEIGFCNCSNKCTCTNVTFMIFQSGNIIVAGLKNESQINIVINDFLNLCKQNKEFIKSNEYTSFNLDKNIKTICLKEIENINY